MKKIVFGVIVIALIVFIIIVSGNKKENVENVSVDTAGFSAVINGEYSLSDASVNWEGKRPLIQGYLDSGTLNLVSGTFSVDSGIISGGEFVFDMNSIQAIATGSGGGADGLTRHLKSADFFDVENFGTAKLVITGSVATSEFTHQVSGLLTMKNETHPIEFIAQLLSKDDITRIVATIPVDRTIWGIKYGSGNFFSDIGEKMIDDIFTVSVDVSANKVTQETVTNISAENSSSTESVSEIDIPSVE